MCVESAFKVYKFKPISEMLALSTRSTKERQLLGDFVP